MQILLDTIRANPWPLMAGLLAIVVMVIAERSGGDSRGDGLLGDFWDADGGDGCGGH
jgi:hypothetical protein